MATTKPRLEWSPVNNSNKITVFGRDHESKGEIYSQALETFNIALAMSVGVTSKSNEDAIGAAAVNSEIVLALADGHWGRDASELAISKAVELLHPAVRPSRDSETRARLFALFEQVNTELYNMAVAAPGAATPETTLIVCHIKEASSGKYLYWSSFGDSYLFLLRKEQLKQLNTLNSFWLGYLSKLSENADTRSILMKFLSDEARYVGVPSGLETGIERLEPGDIIFLCTDGLIGSDREPEPAVLEEIKDILVSDQPLLSKAEKAVASALNRGEIDNISCVMTLISLQMSEQNY
jgi:serine/threonine protein phosphatase PrpC